MNHNFDHNFQHHFEHDFEGCGKSGSVPLLFASSGNWETADCDCACPEAPFQVVPNRPASSHYTALPETLTLPLTQEFYLAFSPLAPSGPSILNQAAWARYQAFQSRGLPLSLPIDYQLSDQHLLVSEQAPPQLRQAPSQQLTAWLHVSNACNLDCPYCYVRKSSEAMDAQTGLQTIDTIFQVARQRQMSQVKLKYAGGEATLQMPLIRQLHQRATELSGKLSIALQAVLLTNGVHLSTDWIDWLATTGMKVMVSLDGIAAVQDRQRPRKGGGKSFECVEQTIARLLQSGIKPHLSITVTATSAPQVAEVVAWALSRSLTFQLNFYRQTALNSSPADWAIEENAIITGLQSAYRVIEQALPDYPLFGGLLDKVQAQAHTHTCGVNQNYLVITHRGQISQCQMHVNQPVGDRFTADTVLSDLAQGMIQNLPVDEKTGCQTCPYRYRCTGGCPLETYQATGRWDVKSPHCNIYRTLYPEVLRLEGLRLLKVNGVGG